MALLKEPKPIYLLNWSEALSKIKNGKRVSREGWNGKGMYVKLVTDCINPSTQTVIEPFMVIVLSSGKMNTWVPSISDNLAEDWVEV